MKTREMPAPRRTTLKAPPERRSTLSSPDHGGPTGRIGALRLFKWFAIAIVLGVFLGFGATLFILSKGAGFDDLKNLEAYKPKLYTKVYDRRGVLLDIISAEKRVVLDYEDIPIDFVHAMVALEDEYFFDHIGVSPLGILAAAKDNIFHRRQRMRGASTLTQQLVKNITKDDRATFGRKFKEQLLSIQLESRFTKAEIFAMYANEVFFGNNQYGIEAAANFYFGKSVGQLNLVECATLAGIPQAPSRFNPLRQHDAVLRKRNIVLARMLEENYITRKEYEEACKEPLEAAPRNRPPEQPVADYFVDKVREYLFARYGEEEVRTSSWDVYTTIDSRYQKIAQRAVRETLKEVDKEIAYRPYDCLKINWQEDPGLLETYAHPSWRTPLQEGLSIYGLVVAVAQDHVQVRIKERSFTLNHENMSWVARSIKDMNAYFKVGDVPLFKVVRVPGTELPPPTTDAAENDEITEDDADPVAEENAPADPQPESAPARTGSEIFPFTLELDQEPDIEGAFMAIDSSTGDILAMVGGYDYLRSKFNRAEQAKRQVGSSIKPIVFGAALEQGYTLSDILFDEPTSFWDPTQFFFDENDELQVYHPSAAVQRKRNLGILPMPKPYQPSNYYNRYVGRVTLRNALAQSLNIVSVKLLNSVGYDQVLEYAYRLKLGSNDLQPFPSLALGAPEISLEDMVYTYGTFAQSGVRYEPRFIRSIMDAKSLKIEENHSKPEQVISPQNAYLVTSAMQAVIFDPQGTAVRARELGIANIAGKTGTTNDYTNAWFVGFNYKIAAGAWVGRDLNQTIKPGATGGGMALPIWLKFMKGLREMGELEDKPFELPEGLITVPVDRHTGKKITLECDCEGTPVLEVFVRGTEPTEVCSKAEQEQSELPWYLQKNTYDYDPLTGSIKPAWVRINNASQLRALEFLENQ